MSTQVAADERLLRGYSGRLLLTVSIGWGVLQGGRLLLSPLLPQIRADLAISNAQAGLAFTAAWGIYALLQYPSGRISDRLSRKVLLVVGLLAACVGFLLIAGAPVYPAFVAGATVLGIGAGLYPTAARALVSDLFVERRGQAFGLHTASGDLGGVLSAGLATLVVAVATWRAAFGPVVVVLVLVAVGIHGWNREPYVVGRVDLAVGRTARRILGDADLRRLLIAYALYAFTWQSAAAFLPTFLQTAKDVSPAAANATFAGFFVVGALVKPVAGGVADAVPRGLFAPALLVVAALTLAGVLTTSSVLAAVVGVVVFAAGLMAYPPVMQSYLMDTFPTDSMGGDLGAMRSIYIGLGALGPTYVGAVTDAISVTTAFAGLVVALVLSAGIILTLEARR